MKRILFIIVLVGLLVLWLSPAWAHNPFTSKPETYHKAPEPPFKSKIFVKIILWQHQLKAAMSDLIRESRTGGGLGALAVLLGLAFLYGMIHAVGPGHGKVVATAYVLTHRTSILGGVLFGLTMAFIHGLSGIAGVLGLHYIIRQSFSDTLASATTTTQIVSFGLITLLGLGIFLKHGYGLLSTGRSEKEASPAKAPYRNLLPWAAAVGLVPCPAVVTVMLFCLSMEALVLGLCLAACICLGMATTIACVVVAVILGKAGMLNVVSEKWAATLEGLLGLGSGAVIAVFGGLFLLAAINASFY